MKFTKHKSKATMNRRRFAKICTQHGFSALAAVGIVPAVARATVPAGPNSAPIRASTVNTRGVASKARRLVKPAKLNRGDLVGLIAPSGATDAVFVEQRVKNLEAFGLKVKVSRNILASRGNTAGTVAARVADLHDMFVDREVKAIWAVRGGSGASQLLPAIDYGLIRRHPKILVGYSDITALHLALLRKSGLVTFHGPVASASFTDYTSAQLESVLMTAQPSITIKMAAENAQRALEAPQFGIRVMSPGVAVGRLVGGNLSVMSALIGTPYAAELNGSLLFLEEVGEAPYRIDRMLTQLAQSGGLKKAAGAMLGVFQKCVVPEGEASLTLAETLDDHFAAAKLPSVYGFSFGHIADQFTIPVGVMARLDTANASLTLLESPVA